MFKVLELQLQNHPFLGDLSLNFTTKDEYENGPYTTVIIGPNGTGKSNILRIITDIFREIENIVNGSEEQELVKCKYQMKYYLDGDVYFYTNSKRKLLQSSKGELSQSLKNNLSIRPKELALPNLIIAFSIMLNDRFFVPKDYKGRIYEYLGVRRLKTPSIGGTQTFTRRIVELLLKNIENENFINHLEEVLGLIGYDKELKMVFYPRYRDKIFTGNLTSEYLNNFYLNWKEVLSKRKSPPYGHSFFINTISKDKYFIEIIVKMINSLTEKYNLNKRGSSIVFSIYDKNIINLYKDNFLFLSSLDLITDFNLMFSKKTNIAVDEVSSGEYHLFSSLIGILALVEENSLILLDEPDISLHPNWQMKYISFLKNIFQNYPTCHFIASTHSHFLVSDMEPSTSHLIGLRKDFKNDIVESLELPKSTFGWTAEEVLYSVFNVKSTRNSYLEYDLTKLITLINRNDKNFIEIRRIKEKIEKLKFSESDPLLIIIEKTEKYLRDNNA